MPPEHAYALDVTTAGRVRWQVPAATAVETLNVDAPGLVSATSSFGASTWQELDPATGRMRWQAAVSIEDTVIPAGIVTFGTASEPGPDGMYQISLRDMLTGRIRWISGLDASEWLSAVQDGPLLIVPVAGSDGSDLLAALRMSDGHRAWQITIPEPVEAPPSAVPGGVLVYAANLVLPC